MREQRTEIAIQMRMAELRLLARRTTEAGQALRAGRLPADHERLRTSLLNSLNLKNASRPKPPETA